MASPKPLSSLVVNKKRFASSPFAARYENRIRFIELLFNIYKKLEVKTAAAIGIAGQSALARTVVETQPVPQPRQPARMIGDRFSVCHRELPVVA
jgi:hypothetical protein